MSLSVHGLSFSYCTRNVLSDITFTASDGTLTAVLGPNGVGKSTLFRCILGLLKKYTGSITLDERDVRTLSPRELANRVAFIPQTRAEAFSFSVLDMVLMGTSHGISMFSTPKQEELHCAHAALERIGIERLADKNYTHLSGGEQQLVMIARALAQNSKLLLMDEPTANLDYGNQALVLDTARSLANDGYTVLLSTHNPQQALSYADTALLMKDGQALAFGAPDDVITSGHILALYGVEAVFLSDRGQKVISYTAGGRAHV